MSSLPPKTNWGKLVLPGLVSPFETSDETLANFPPDRILRALSYDGVLYGLPPAQPRVLL